MSQEKVVLSEESEMRILTYRIDNETYGSPLLSIREVLEYQKPKFMPNMVKHFSGVINVRGVIVGVVDLRVKLGSVEEIQKRSALLLCDTDNGPLAALVDGVDSVIQLKSQDWDKQPPVKTRTALNYVIGVAKVNDHLITLIDLHKLLFEDELKTA